MSDIIFGIHAVRAVYDKDSGRIETLYLQQGKLNPRQQAILQLAENARTSVERIDKASLDRLAGGNHQGVAAECRATRQRQKPADMDSILEGLDHPPFILVLDSVQDPHNLGACLRSADAAGVDMVIVPKDKAVSLTDTVSKVACGAAEQVPLVTVTNLARTLRDLKDRGIWLMGLAGEASDPIYQADLTGPLALVLGGEAKGLRRLTRDTCDRLLAIPMFGTVESLNVSVAAGVCLFEATRQRSALTC